MPSLIFCTLFDSRYASRGFAMLDSLEAYCRAEHEVVVLAMDDAAADMLTRCGRPGWRTVRVPDLGDAEFTALEATRPRREFCWTAAAVLCHALATQANEGDHVVYLDADLLFYRDPSELLAELGSNGAIIVHEHRYSPDRTFFEQYSGRFNVGFVAFRIGEESRRCLDRWRDQVIETCELDADLGLCGDQGYLNEWPALYPGLRILANLGGGVAPWNLAAYEVGGTRSAPTVNGAPIVFFHFHAFRTVSLPSLGYTLAVPAYGYEFSARARRTIFGSYARRVRAWHARLAAAGFVLATDLDVGLKDGAVRWAAGKFVLAVP